jgi:hypothetical protein
MAFTESIIEGAALLSGELRVPSPRLRQAGVPSAGKSVNHTA